MAVARENIHIHAPELLTPPQRARDTLLTAAMWAFYLYLWVPLISLLAWLLGFELAYDVMIRSGGARNNASLLFGYAKVVGVICCTITSWSILYRLRFHRVTRSRFSQRVDDEAILNHFKLTLDQLLELRLGKVVSVETDENGQPENFSADRDTGHSSGLVAGLRPIGAIGNDKRCDQSYEQQALIHSQVRHDVVDGT